MLYKNCRRIYLTNTGRASARPAVLFRMKESIIIPDNLKNACYSSKPLSGISTNDGFQRLDPSHIIFHRGVYHAYWTKAPAGRNLYTGSIWHGTSADGRVWQEKSEVLSRSSGNDWDNFGVITPYIVPFGGRFYLFYTASHESVGKPWAVRGEENKRRIGVAVSSEPEGPFERFSDTPVLSPSEEGWDSYLVDDTHVMVVDGMFYLYYKGGDVNVTPDTTKWGLAVSENIIGPYRKHEDNPVTNSGHTVCIIKFGRGFAALFDNAGPQKHTLQYSSDGINFRLVKSLGHIDTGCGAYDPSAFYRRVEEPGMIWGLTAEIDCSVPFLKRFEIVF